MRFVDYKCNECGIVNEYVISGSDNGGIKCSGCGSSNTVRVFTPVGFKSSSSGSDSDFAGSSSSSGGCSGGSCSNCSGGCH
ncbi:MAG: zinc ribbon domain-containing protein [Actinobacteria bacterium]|nr:zinc ribbon domain-containing protein [Actinomycetota bacterium]